MAKRARKPKEQGGELIEVNFVRAETLLRRYPMHILQKGSRAKELVISDVDAGGHEVVKWCVMFTAREGAPGELAYRIDRLIIDKFLEKQTEIPKLVRLGTFNEMCEALGIASSGQNMKAIKTALLQLQGTAIEVAHDLAEGRFYRYPSIVFTGDKRSDGTRSDAIYLELSTTYQTILKRATRRPLDYDYLWALPPGSSRLYELLSSRIFAALQKGGRNPEARILYSEFAELAALTRYTIQWEMKKQMKRLNEPHIESGYISGVSYDGRTDKRGMPDWMMIYTPGEKARHEFKAAMKRGEVQKLGDVIKIGPATEVMRTHETKLIRDMRINTEEPLQASFEFPVTAPLNEAQELAGRLIAAGGWVTKAQALVELYPDATRVWVDVYERGLLGKKDDPAAYLVKAIGENAQPPKAYREAKEVGKREADAREREIQAKQRGEAKRESEREELTRMRSYLEGLSLENAQSFDQDALATLPLVKRKMLDLLQGGGREETLDCYRLAHWRQVQQLRERNKSR